MHCHEASDGNGLLLSPSIGWLQSVRAPVFCAQIEPKAKEMVQRICFEETITTTDLACCRRSSHGVKHALSSYLNSMIGFSSSRDGVLPRQSVSAIDPTE